MVVELVPPPFCILTSMVIPPCPSKEAVPICSPPVPDFSPSSSGSLTKSTSVILTGFLGSTGPLLAFPLILPSSSFLSTTSSSMSLWVLLASLPIGERPIKLVSWISASGSSSLLSTLIILLGIVFSPSDDLDFLSFLVQLLLSCGSSSVSTWLSPAKARSFLWITWAFLLFSSNLLFWAILSRSNSSPQSLGLSSAFLERGQMLSIWSLWDEWHCFSFWLLFPFLTGLYWYLFW